MKTVLLIAWRNLWRNKLRTMVIIVSVILGLWGSMFFMSLMQGMNDSRINSAINTYLSHIQLHSKSFLEDPVLENKLQKSSELLSRIQSSKFVKAYSERLIVDAMLSTSKGSYGAKLIGVNPTHESRTSNIPKHLIAGSFLNKYKKPSVIIGKKLADKLGLKLRSKVKFSFQNKAGDILSYAFRVEGIYKINNAMIEGMNVYMKLSSLEQILQTQGEIHEIGIMLNDVQDMDKLKTSLQSISPQNRVQSWDEVSPELGYAQEMMATFSYIFLIIILIALAFAIINTMLMAVLERRRELGIMMAIGFNKRKLFAMVVVETILLAAISTPVGMFLSYQSIAYFGRNGLHFLSVSEGLEYLGISSKIYTHLDTQYYFTITLLTLFTTFVAALIPARKALGTEPIKAIREI